MEGTSNDNPPKAFTKLQNYETGIQEFVNFIIGESKSKDRFVLIFYTKFEMCAFLKYCHCERIHFTDGKMGPTESYINTMQMGGVEYFCYLKLDDPIQPLDEVVGLQDRDLDMISSAECLAKYCSDDQILQCYGIQPFLYKEGINILLQGVYSPLFSFLKWKSQPIFNIFNWKKSYVT